MRGRSDSEGFLGVSAPLTAEAHAHYLGRTHTSTPFCEITKVYVARIVPSTRPAPRFQFCHKVLDSPGFHICNPT